MKASWVRVLVLCALVCVSLAWSPVDHEIFRLKDEVEKYEGPDVSFYDLLGLTPSATVDEVVKAFKKKSRTLHPDKVKHSFIAARSTGKPKKPGEKPGVHVSKGPSQKEINKAVKEAEERYRRLGVVRDVLKGPQRERYDHFMKYGFPAWRGTGYYYSRYRPGLGTVITGLFLVGGGAVHYFILVTTWKRQRDFMERYIRQARKMAWGDESGIIGIPGISSPAEPTIPTPEPDPSSNLNRKQRREMERRSAKKNGGRTPNNESSKPEVVSTPQGQKRRVTAENGKVLVVDSASNVFLEEEDEEGNVHEYLLDLDEVPRPTFRDTAVIKVPAWLFRKAFDPFLKNTTSIPSDEVPQTESEKAKHEELVQDDLQPEVPAPKNGNDNGMSSSQMSEGFEMVDSAVGEDENVGSGKVKKRKKGKK
jgi:curved DNA-binding protein CbpA